MLVVIFRAQLGDMDESYAKTAKKMRELATDIYGCVEISSVTEGGQEITVSYWESEEQIIAWKNDPEHRRAQQLGKEKWYRSYQVEIASVEREYEND